MSTIAELGLRVRRRGGLHGRPARRPQLISDALARRYQALSRSAGTTAAWWSPWPTRPTSSRSTTSAPSPAPRCARSSPPVPRSLPPSTSTTGSTPTPSRSAPRPRAASRPTRTSRPSGRSPRDAPIVKLVNLLITQAVQDRASDIHIERPNATCARPLPHRRRAPRSHAVAEEHPVGHHQPPEDHGRHQHRRAPRPPGRPHQRDDRRQGGRTCGSPRCRRCTARRSSCGSWTSRTRY